MGGAVMACSSPVHPGKKFKQKSAAGRKPRVSPDRVSPEEQAMSFDSPAISATASREGMKFARRAGASMGQRVLSRGRGASEKNEMTGMGRVVVRQEGAHARLHARAAVKEKKQGRLTIETDGEQRERRLEERFLGRCTQDGGNCDFRQGR
ncbi:hypothetical protein NDU88_003583 [Pleurodeles waltl]|uniref:Uncharacterized protein n=1 Tax=Pleurodeles waltl TaxID=8319 RepID=A0AAV7TRN6_PLEWA|nr:hypothetical protein NDU88_003583 [Pleurodeles waltl]